MDEEKVPIVDMMENADRCNRKRPYIGDMASRLNLVCEERKGSGERRKGAERSQEPKLRAKMPDVV